jgi:hypothetical protein
MQLLGAFSFPRLSLKRPEKSSRHPVRFGSPEGAKVEVPNFAAVWRGGGGALAGCLDLSVGGILFLGKLNINFLLLTFIVSGAWASVRKGPGFPLARFGEPCLSTPTRKSCYGKGLRVGDQRALE